MKFELVYKPDECIVDVYDIRYFAGSIYPWFLIYHNDEWMIEEGYKFRPVTPQDMFDRYFKK